MKFQAGIAAALLLAAGSSHAESEIDKFLSTNVITASDAKTVDQRCNAVLKLAGRTKAAIEKRKGAASIKADFVPYDDLSNLLTDTGGEMDTISATNPREEVRNAAKDCISKVSDFATKLSLSRPTYDRLPRPRPGRRCIWPSRIAPGRTMRRCSRICWPSAISSRSFWAIPTLPS